MSDNFEITDGVINMLYDQRTKNEAQQTQLGTLPSSSLNESQSFFKEEDDRQGQYSQEEDSSNQNLAGQTENEKKKVKKSPRNTQNSYRTITRALKKYAQKNWKISIEKFFQVEKPMNTLAILKKQAQAGRLTNVLGELANHKKFKQILSGSNVEEKKDQKVKKILQYLLNLTQQSFNEFQISETIKKLSQIGQLKSHPIKNMSVEKLMQIQANFTLIK